MIRGATLLFLLPLALPVVGQQPTLTVQPADNQTTFHIGEPIVLNLTIATPADREFVVAPWESGRGGEFDLDTVAATPATARAPAAAPAK